MAKQPEKDTAAELPAFDAPAAAMSDEDRRWRILELLMERHKGGSVSTEELVSEARAFHGFLTEKSEGKA